jgi:cell division protein FtsI (penicillin-binding protein 3)
MSQRIPAVRVFVLMIAASLSFVGLMGRLYYLQVVRAEETRERSERARKYTEELPPARGRIVDRHNRPLALGVWRYTVTADLTRMKKPRTTLTKAADILGLTQEQIDSHVNAKSGLRGRPIKMDVTQDMKNALEEMKLPGIHFEKTDFRYYPEGMLAGPLLGFTGRDNNGLEGLELSNNEWLKGNSQEIRSSKDPRRKLLAEKDYTKMLTQGADAILTIDSYIQYIAERELQAVVDEYQAVQGYAVVMHAKSGEVLALANAPSLDPNRYEEYSLKVRKNRAIANIFEPGSVVKPFVIAGALEQGVVTPDTMIFCENGLMYFPGRPPIRDDIHRFGLISVHDVLVRSSNIGTVKIAQLMSEDWRGQAQVLYHTLKKFGFGEKSTYDLPGESKGKLRAPNEWEPASIAAVPYGQEFETNALILTTAYCAMANRGLFRPAKIIRGYRGQEGPFIERDAEKPHRVISERTADQIIRMMVDVTEDPEGTGDKVRIPGFHIAGKTGTAQKYDPEIGTYGRGMHFASFCGFFPAEDPEIVITVVVDDPQHAKYGGAVAGPVWKRIAEEIIAYWGIAPTNQFDPLLEIQDNKTIAAKEETNSKSESFGVNHVLPAPIATSLNPLSNSMPDLVGMPLRDAFVRLRLLGMKAHIEGVGKVMWQDPPAGASIAALGTAELRCEPALTDPSLRESAVLAVQQ